MLITKRCSPRSFGRGNYIRILLLALCFTVFLNAIHLKFFKYSGPRQHASNAIIQSDENHFRKDDDLVMPNSGAKLQSDSARTTKLNSFSFCKELNEATFSRTIDLMQFSNSILNIRLSNEDYANIIDTTAQRKYRELINSYGSQFVDDELRRFTCYMAAEGNNEIANLSRNSLLIDINLQTYFGNVVPAFKVETSIPQPKRVYDIAYLLMVHDSNPAAEIINLINLLDDGHALILLHVDVKSEHLFLELSSHFNSLNVTSGNLHFAEKRFDGRWGHSTLVFIQLSGFFELLDLGNWSHVINLSGEDFPLRATEDIARALKEPRYQNKSLIQFWDSPLELASRLLVPVIGSSARNHYEQSFLHAFKFGTRAFPFGHWHLTKHHQWMILARDFVEHLRVDLNAGHALAFAEHAAFTDESYFSTVINNDPYFSARVFNGNKRYTRFNGGAHPDRLSMRDSFLFPVSKEPGEEPEYFFIRKVKAGEQHDFVEWIKENHIERNRGHAIIEGHLGNK